MKRILKLIFGLIIVFFVIIFFFTLYSLNEDTETVIDIKQPKKINDQYNYVVNSKRVLVRSSPAKGQVIGEYEKYQKFNSPYRNYKVEDGHAKISLKNDWWISLENLTIVNSKYTK